jgi:hypothetical protein
MYFKNPYDNTQGTSFPDELQQTAKIMHHVSCLIDFKTDTLEDIKESLRQFKEHVLFDIRVKSRRQTNEVIKIQEDCSKKLGYNEEHLTEEHFVELLDAISTPNKYRKSLLREEYKEMPLLMLTNLRILLRRLVKHTQLASKVKEENIPVKLQPYCTLDSDSDSQTVDLGQQIEFALRSLEIDDLLEVAKELNVMNNSNNNSTNFFLYFIEEADKIYEGLKQKTLTILERKQKTSVIDINALHDEIPTTIQSSVAQDGCAVIDRSRSGSNCIMVKQILVSNEFDIKEIGVQCSGKFVVCPPDTLGYDDDYPLSGNIYRL